MKFIKFCIGAILFILLLWMVLMTLGASIEVTFY